MQRLPKAAMMAALSLVSASLTYGQVTARQGTSKEESNDFKSPMILEAPFIANTPSLWTGNWVSGKDYVGLRKYRCERLFIETLQLSAKRMGADKINVRIKAGIRNPDGNHDKSVRLRFDVFNEEKNIGHVELEPLKVEESDHRSAIATLLLPIDEISANPPPKLKITMSVWDK